MAGLALLDRAWGRPASFSTADANEFRRAIELSDAELIKIAAERKLREAPKLVPPAGAGRWGADLLETGDA